MPQTRLAIDYGTSNTVAVLALPDGRTQPLLFEGTPLLPSAVFAESDGSLSVGRDAQRQSRLNPARYEPNPKRRVDDLEVLLGERSHALTELIAAALRVVALEAARVAGGPVTELTMTCPVEWGPARRAALVDAAASVGLPRPGLVPEPVAAATYFGSLSGSRVPAGRCVVVYDLGGGTFDACVLRCTTAGFDVLSHRGLDDFGGVDLDALVVGQIGASLPHDVGPAWQRLTRPSSPEARRAFRMLWDDARDVKEALSRRPQAGLFVPMADRDVHVAREAFEQAASPVLRRTAEVTRATVREARIRPDEIAAVFLVGGSSRMPMVATLLHRELGVAPTVLEQPELVVATGALSAGRPASPDVPISAPPQEVPAAAMSAAGPMPAPARAPGKKSTSPVPLLVLSGASVVVTLLMVVSHLWPPWKAVVVEIPALVLPVVAMLVGRRCRLSDLVRAAVPSAAEVLLAIGVLIQRGNAPLELYAELRSDVPWYYHIVRLPVVLPVLAAVVLFVAAMVSPRNGKR